MNSLKPNQIEVLLSLATTLIGTLLGALTPGASTTIKGITGIINNAILQYFEVMHPDNLPDPTDTANKITKLPD